MSTTPTSPSSDRSALPGLLLVIALAAIAGAAAGCSGGGGSGPQQPICKAGTAGCACRSGGGCDAGLSCDGQTCAACTAGQAGCACRSNGTCEAGLACGAGEVCLPCAAGSETCPCRPDGTCSGDLQCRNAFCVAGGTCADGALSCPCRTGGACDGELVCSSGTCHTCGSDVPGCPCGQDGVCQGLVCDAGSCRASKSCADLCNADQQCTPATTTTDAVCLAACKTSGYVWNPAASRCEPASAICPACNGAGEDGLWPSLTAGGKCICKTKPGYFYTLSGLVGTYPCDADQDGWVRSTAWYAISSTDPALRANARCDLRTVDTFVLHNDQGQQRAFSLGEVLPLYESVRNDDQASLDLDSSAAVPPYGGAGGRRLRAVELNSLTKACVSERADHNDNQLADISEWGRPSSDQAALPSGAFPGGTVHFFELYTRWSYFVELDRGWYEARGADQPGLYHVAEKDRTIGAGFPLTYGVEASGFLTSEYWRECPRARDFWYKESLPPIGLDFASVSPPNREWKGMGHSSQFKCVQVVSPDVYAASSPSVNRHLQTVESLGDPVAGGTLPTQDYLRAMVNACTAEAGGTPGSGKNPTDPVISCSAKLPDPAHLGGVYWAAVRLVNTSSYYRGCILQCDGFPFLCPGTSPTGPAAQKCYHLCGDVAASEAGNLRSGGGYRLRGEVPATTPVANGPVGDQTSGYRVTPR